MKDPKEHYANNLTADWNVTELHHMLIRQILKFNPSSAFEFGCGLGKLLSILKNYDVNTFGIDINNHQIQIAKQIGLKVEQGTEASLETIQPSMFDVVYTCSVLGHIRDIRSIIQKLEQMSRKATILCEPVTKVEGQFYYPQRYQDYGFDALDYEYFSKRDKRMYKIWVKFRA